MSRPERLRTWMWLHPFATGILAIITVITFATANAGTWLGRGVVLAIVIAFTVYAINVRDRPPSDEPQREPGVERDPYAGISTEHDSETGELRVIMPYDAENARRRAAAVAAGVYVKAYPDQAAFQRHAAILATDHWVVSTVVERKPNAGCLRIALLWWLVLIFPPRPELLVTYRHEPPAAPKPDLDVRVRTARPAPSPEPAPAAAAAATPPTTIPPHLEPVTHQACFTCGAIVSITHNFCPNCGARLGLRTPPTPADTPIPMPAPNPPPADPGSANSDANHPKTEP
ncbi:MAG: zinc ribbon domain-containing protein [Thermomicrobiales bacterium]